MPSNFDFLRPKWADQYDDALQVERRPLCPGVVGRLCEGASLGAPLGLASRKTGRGDQASRTEQLRGQTEVAAFPELGEGNQYRETITFCPPFCPLGYILNTSFIMLATRRASSFFPKKNARRFLQESWKIRATNLSRSLTLT